MFSQWQFRELREANDPGGAGNDPPQDPPAPVTYGEDIIPEELRGRDPAEIRLLLSQMPQIVKAQKQELQDLRIQMAGGAGPTVTHGPPAPVVVKTAEEAQAEFEELFDKNPREAIKKFIAEEYAPQIAGMETRIDASEFSRVKSGIANFDDYEEDVNALLTQSGAPATEANVRGAYAMAVGNRQIAKDALMARAADGPIVADPAPEGDPAVAPLEGLEAEVAGHMGLDAAEFRKYSDPNSLDLKIRT